MDINFGVRQEGIRCTTQSGYIRGTKAIPQQIWVGMNCTCLEENSKPTQITDVFMD